VKLPLIVILANLAPICLAFLLAPFMESWLTASQFRHADHFILLVGEVGGPMTLSLLLGNANAGTGSHGLIRLQRVLDLR
jgi:hypothetical protein